MKKFLFSLIAACSLFGTMFVTSGCDDKCWNPELVYKTSYCIGITASAIVDSRHYPAEVTDASLKILDKCRAVIPNEGQTFSDAWMPIVDQYLAETKDIQEPYKPLVRTALQVVVTAIDMKVADNPKILEVEGYARSAIDGLTNGYMVYIKPSNTVVNTTTVVSAKTPAAYTAPEIDYDLYHKVAVKCFGEK